ncbi:hypothetical protein, partial [Polynucleobacter sp. AP-Latsch-80-C2]|uniref:hypothetical protein n=1 Tax=Polynucleobacter sp. AP-Latsch-80-C2 TaxID=2576931 RepID=UPI001C0DF2D0
MTISTGGAVSLSAINTANVLAVTGNGIALNGSITTTGAQTYTGAVTLGSDIVLTSSAAGTSGDITFSST